MKYSIVIPCYNEEDNLPNLIKSISEFAKGKELEFVLVENGSKDNSFALMKDLTNDKEFIKIVKVEVNQGYGYGLHQGIKAASGDYIGWIHADLQLPLADVSQFLDRIDTYNGSQKLFLKGTRHNRSLVDYFFTYGMTCFESVLFGRWLFDIGAIPVFFDRSLLAVLERVPKDFSVELFIYNKAKAHGYKVERLPVHLLKREKGKSSWNTGLMSRVKQSMRIIKASFNIKKGNI
jgi:glycosyltransferase involved in cell wall biosynthesis